MRRRPFQDNGDPPRASDWRDYGKPTQRLADDDVPGFETPGVFKRTMLWIGERFGAARVPWRAPIEADGALGPEAAPNRYAQAAGEVRAAAAEEDGHAAMKAPSTTIAAASARADGAAEDLVSLNGWIEWLTVTVLPDCRAGLVDAERMVDKRRAEWRDLSASERGYGIAVAVVVAVVAAVSAFDAFIVHSALERAGVGLASLWGTTVTVPLVIGAINHAFGVLAGAIAVRVPAERTRMAAVAFVAGIGALMAAFATLAIFRHQSVKTQNETLAAIADGDASQRLDFFLSPLWMGPLQVAGSIAAIALVALWTAAKAGRDAEARIGVAETDRGAAEARVRGAELDIRSARLELRRVRQLPFEIRAASASAEVEIETVEAVVATQVTQERALAKALQALYEAEFIATDKIYANGEVWRCAMPTDDRLLSRRVTPAPTVKPSTAEGSER